MLVDSFGRKHTDLRISVTDRCNIRCRYCMSAESAHWRPHDELLSFEEVVCFVRVAAQLGICKLRLTGGEPLVRKDVARLVEMLAAIPGIAEVDMTTNAVLLGEYAGALKAAGLHRLNVSLDTLSPDRFANISRRDLLPQVLQGIEAALGAGFSKIKLNAVAIRGSTEAEIVPLASFARQRGLELRFIELMPLDGDRQWTAAQVLPGEEILAILAAAFGPLQRVSPPTAQGPATNYQFADGIGRIGLVPSVTHPFCGHCKRLRLTADGKLRNCLFSDEEWDVRAVLRSGGTIEQLISLIEQSVGAKKKARGTDHGDFARVERPMHQIGG
jgi:GTP 3',8-cyclase